MPPKQKQKQEDQQSDEELIAIIAGAFAIGASVQATATTLSTLIGIVPAILASVWKLAITQPLKYGSPATVGVTTARAESERLEPFYRAQYVLAASRRVAEAVKKGTPLNEAVARENRYFAQHLEAMLNRASAARAVDTQAKRHGNLLGWYAKMDNRTSKECRDANGKNFNANERPAIGYPGSVHPHCRCRAGKAHATRQTVYSVKPEERAA